MRSTIPNDYQLATSTEPVDRSLTECALHEVYREGGFAPPERIVWAASPVAARKFLDPGSESSLLSVAGKPIGRTIWSDPIAAGVQKSYENKDWSVLIMGGPGALLSVQGPEIPIAEAVQENACIGNMAAVHISNYLWVEMPPIPAKVELIKHCGWFYPFEDLCVACERPLRISLNEVGRLHRADGPALELRCGYQQFAWNGFLVTEQFIRAPETLTVVQIETEPNVEVRRLMMERFGKERFLIESGTEPIQSDDWGTLYRKELPRDEPLVMVKVINSTPEPDGTFREYFLRVPPTMRTAREAVAWTFGKRETDYAPDIEA